MPAKLPSRVRPPIFSRYLLRHNLLIVALLTIVHFPRSSLTAVVRLFQIVVTMIEVAMDHKPSHRELTSILLSDLYQECLTQTDITRGTYCTSDL